MAFTHKTVTQWNCSAKQQREIPDLMEERTEWLLQAVEDGKTEDVTGTPTSNDSDESNENAVSERVWNSAESAQEWKTFIEGLATKYNKEATVTISSL